jgi:NAD(P)-dependent dehydrogenase (short-subunit alcohol dehydrogenase family)
MKELEGRVGIVTGGSSGIGYAIANVLAENGAAMLSAVPEKSKTALRRPPRVSHTSKVTSPIMTG